MKFLPSRPWAGGSLARALPWLGCFFVVVVAPLLHVASLEEGWIIPKIVVLSFGALLLWIERSRQALLGRTAIFKTDLDGAILAFWIVLILSSLGSIDRPISLMGQYRGPFHGLLAMAIYTLIFYGVSSNEEITPGFLIDMLLAAGSLVCCIAISQIGSPLDGGRVWGTFGAPIFLGSFLALILPLAWARAREDGGMGFLTVMLAVVTIVAAKARGAALSSAAGVLVYELMIGNIVEVVIMGGTGVAFLLCWHPIRASSDLSRLEIYKAAVIAWAHHPLLGGGPDTFALLFRRYAPERMNAVVSGDAWIQMSAHNDVLQVLSTMGLLGLAAYGAFVTKLYLTLRRSVGSNARMILAAFVSVFIVAKFNPLHISVIAACAALAGSMTFNGQARAWRWPAYGVAFAAYLVLSLSRQQAKAEYLVSYGNQLNRENKVFAASDMFHAAALANPLEMYYVDREMRQLWAVSGGVDHGDMKRVAAAAITTLDQAVRLHPNDPVAHDLRALALKDLSIGFADNTIKQSQVEMERAVTLAPTFKAYTRDAMNIAREMGDRPSEARHRAVLDRLIALEAGRL